jgi:prepilin-type N-terminal cleavage/methylation domain-containing protein
MIRQNGFTLIELIIVVSIIGVLTALTVPTIRNYNSHVDLKNTAQLIRDELRSLFNRAQNGGVSTSNMSSGDRSYWAMRIDNSANTYYEIAPCDSFDFTTCTTDSDYRQVKLPDRFHISHNVSGKTRIILFFVPIQGSLLVYDSTPAIVSVSSVTLTISSDEYTAKDYTVTINSKGSITIAEI